MRLCHLIDFDGHSVSHSITEFSSFDFKRNESTLVGPFELSFCNHSFVADISKLPELDTSSSFSADIIVDYHCLLIDDLEGRPLIGELSQARSLFLLGELLDGIFESARVMGINLKKASPNLAEKSLMLKMIIGHDRRPTFVIGALLCFMTSLNALLYTRGLKIDLTVKKTFKAVPESALISLLRQVIEEVL